MGPTTSYSGFLQTMTSVSAGVQPRVDHSANLRLEPGLTTQRQPPIPSEQAIHMVVMDDTHWSAPGAQHDGEVDGKHVVGCIVVSIPFEIAQRPRG